MQIIIEIDDFLYTQIMQGSQLIAPRVDKFVQKGTPLPIDHGKIGDLDKILTWLVWSGTIDEMKCKDVADVFNDATLIERSELFGF